MDVESLESCENCRIIGNKFGLTAQVGGLDAAESLLYAGHPVLILPPIGVILVLPFAIVLHELSVLGIVELFPDFSELSLVCLAVPLPVFRIRVTVNIRIFKYVYIWEEAGSVSDERLDESCSCRGPFVQHGQRLGGTLAMPDHVNLLA